MCDDERVVRGAVMNSRWWRTLYRRNESRER